MFCSSSFYFFIMCACCCVHISNPSIVIIGAGAAGIAAATKLLENSITDLTILEAESRIGGRIHSIQIGNAFVDLGAEYCHGEKNNVVYRLAKDFNILQQNYASILDNAYYSNGSKLDSNFIKDIESVLTQLKESIDEGFDVSGKSLGHTFIRKYNSTLFKKFEGDPGKLKLLREGLRYAEGYVVGFEGSFSWFDSAAENDYEECEGRQDIIWNGCGYKTILEILMRSYPDPSKKLPIDDKIQLKKKVTNVKWNESAKIIVQTSDKTSFSADYVIFTPSVGVLKAKHKTMFDPALPLSKQTAIEATGFAAVIKIVMYFNDKWWKNEDKIFSFFWSEEDLKSADFSDGPAKNALSWIYQVREVVEPPNNPNVLIGWISGDLVPEIEKMPIETLRNGCAYVLDRFLGKAYNITEINQILKSTWYSNKNFHGTYSFTKAGFYNKNLSHQEELAKPLKNVKGSPALLFAGEATHPVYYSTVHGAIETGFREADRIIKLLGQNP